MNRIFGVLVLLLALAIGFYVVISGDYRTGVEPVPIDQLEENVDYYGEGVEGDRSSKWRSVRNAFVAAHPVCEACGSDEDLNVHHVQPFHSHPELELDWDNLTTLCREHHYMIGHDPDGPWGPEKPSWKKSNPNVRRDAAEFRLSL